MGGGLTYSDARVRVGGLHQLFALMPDHPVGVDLRGSLGVQVDHLELPEVRHADGVVLGAHVEDVGDAVVVEVVLAGVPPSVSCSSR